MTILMNDKAANSEINIYVADLAAYNNGYLHGIWIDATEELSAIQEQINAMLSKSPVGFAEEYAVHDYEGFGGYSVGEYEGIEKLHKVACFIKEHSEVAGDLLAHFGGSLEDARKSIEENYSGCYKSLADYAEELTDGTTTIPSNLAFYIDYDRMARDMEMSGDIFTVEAGFEEIHVFWSH